MDRHGLTMLELLLSLALLVGLTMTIAAWIGASARLEATVVRGAHWRSAAEAALQLIQDDLVQGDWSAPAGKKSGGDKEQHSVRVSGSALEIDSRLPMAGATTCRYVLHNGQVEREEQVTTRGNRGFRGRGLGSRLLLGEVRRFEFELDEDAGVLHITIHSTDGERVVRGYRL